MLIFEKGKSGRINPQHLSKSVKGRVGFPSTISQSLQRNTKPHLPQVSELEAVRHYTKLSQKNYSITTELYPLGSCTMKYNPWVCHTLASHDRFLSCHPASSSQNVQGTLQILYELQKMLATICGMQSCSLTPMAGAQGEFAGMLMIKKYLQKKKLHYKTQILIPESAHGTNPASAVMCGFEVIEVKSEPNGNTSLSDLKSKIGKQTAGIMLTNPSTYGLYESNITEIAAAIHKVDGLLYYDGANLNALLGKVTPGDIGFDVMHSNLHKTFATPHGGGGPGSGAILANKKLAPFLPNPYIIKNKRNGYEFSTHSTTQSKESIGQLSQWFGNIGVLIRAYIYIRLVGKEYLSDVSDYAVLNANYLMSKMLEIGYTSPFANRYAGHEFIISMQNEKKIFGVTAHDLAKNMLDYGYHAPTTYFPTNIPECLLFEPTETESKQDIDGLIAALKDFKARINARDPSVKTAPNKCMIAKVDETQASHPKFLDIAYKKE